LSRLNVKYKGPLKGEVIPPSDKSISHRAIMLASLASGKSTISNLLRAEDPLRTLNAFRMMGIESEEDPHSGDLIITGRGLNGLRELKGVIDCGNSGTTMRLMSGVLAGQPFTSILTGDKYLLKRPMQRIIDPLTEMGAVISSEKGGLPPLNIKGGNLRPIQFNSPIASAQVKSAVLLAGLYCDGVTSVFEPGKSRDHTERMFQAAGVEVIEAGQKVSVKGIATLNPMDITVPGDFSSAAFFIVAGLLIPGSEILIKNVGINPTRSGLISILKEMMGSDIEHLNARSVSGEPVADILVKHSGLKGVNVGSNRLLRSIDEFPILCIAAAMADGITKITGARELRVKESDRIASMASELKKMGVSVQELEDGIIIEGRKKLTPGNVQSHGDHRIAMSMYIAGLATEGETLIEDTDCINTSFPGFVETIDNLTDRV
jgi:3-phosphoshikimate 1-carboxyvinyltransferase